MHVKAVGVTLPCACTHHGRQQGSLHFNAVYKKELAIV